MAKIHKTLSDIQGQLLGIPISTIVVATQFKEASTAPGQLWINVAVLTGATIFCVLLFISLWNQKHSLDVISDEVTRHETGLKRQSEELASKLSSVFEKLRTRVRWHKAALLTIFGVAVAAWIVGSVVFWMCHAQRLTLSSLVLTTEPSRFTQYVRKRFIHARAFALLASGSRRGQTLLGVVAPTRKLHQSG